MDEKYDAPLLGILSNEGKIDRFLDVIFGFLYRRTDFYKLMPSPDAKFGFPPGVAEKLVRCTFQKYDAIASKADNRSSGSDASKATQPSKPNKSASQTKQAKSISKKEASPAASGEATPEVTSPASSAAASPAAGDTPATPVGASDTKAAAATVTDTAPQKASSKEAEEDADSGERKHYSAPAESYNGAECGGYRWSQWISELDVRLDVPPHVKRGRDVQVQISRQHLRVQHRPAEAEDLVTMLDAPLCWPVNKEESIWSLVPQDHVHVHLEKVQERWWEALVEGEEKINIRKIDCSRNMTDLDDEAQAKIAQMMYDQEQKRQGKPTSEEQKTASVLKGAWNAEGSPFQGTPYDPSLVNMSSEPQVQPPP